MTGSAKVKLHPRPQPIHNLFTNPLGAEFNITDINIGSYYISSLSQWKGISNLNSSSWKTRAPTYLTINSMAADVLVIMVSITLVWLEYFILSTQRVKTTTHMGTGLHWQQMPLITQIYPFMMILMRMIMKSYQTHVTELTTFIMAKSHKCWLVSPADYNEMLHA